MSGYANLNAYADPNVLLQTQGGQAVTNIAAQQIANQYAPQRNQLFISGEQQKQGENEIEYMARAAQGLLDPAAYPDEASRAAAYPGVVASLQRYGFAKNAPSQYPGEGTLRQVAGMGMSSEERYKLAAGRAALDAVYPTGTTPPPAGGPGGGGPGYAPTGAPLTPYIAPNLPQGVSTAEDQAVRTVIGEAGGEPTIGQAGVAHVIANRMKQSGGSAQDVIFAPNQFEPWNNPATRAKLEGIDPNSAQYQTILNNVVRPALAGQSQDPTGGATHFYSPTAQAALGRQPPSWGTGTPTVIGRHNFYNIGYAAPPGGGTGTGTAQAGGQPPAGPVVLGDSLAVGLGGQPGTSREGASPQRVLAQVQEQAKSGALRGQDVVISTGASNDPSATALAEQQIQAAKDGGAKSVTLVGVGNRPDIAGANPLLAQIAQRNGARFVPVDPATLSGDQVHPANYAPLRQAVRLGGTAAAGPAAGAPPASTAPPAGAPATGTTTTDPETGLPVLSAPRNAILPAPPPPAAPQPAPSSAAPQPGSQVQPPAPPVVRPPAAVPLPPPPPPLDNQYLTAQDRQDLAREKAAFAASGNPNGAQLLTADMERRANLNVQRQQYYQTALEKQRADDIAAQQLTLSGANTVLEYWKQANPDLEVTKTGDELIATNKKTGQVVSRTPITPDMRPETMAMNDISRLAPKMAAGPYDAQNNPNGYTPADATRYAVAVDTWRQPELRDSKITGEQLRVNKRELPANFPPPLGEQGRGGGPQVVVPGYSPAQQAVERDPAQAKVADTRYNRDAKNIDTITNDVRQLQDENFRVQEMQNIIQNISTGPGTEGRTQAAAWLQRWLPAEVTGWKRDSPTLDGADAAQVFQKLAFQGSVAQEKGADPRGGYGITKLFQGYNPGLDLLNLSNKNLLDMQLIKNQAKIDYNQQANEHFNTQEQRYNDTHKYDSLNVFDEKWNKQRNPQVYAAAMGAAGGLPAFDGEYNGAKVKGWTNGLSDDEYARALQIVSRADPSATVNGKNGRISMQPKVTQGGVAAAPGDRVMRFDQSGNPIP